MVLFFAIFLTFNDLFYMTEQNLSYTPEDSEPLDAPDFDDSPKSRLPPHSLEAEQSLLGALMLDSNAWGDVIEYVTEKDFYRLEHRVIFSAIGELVQQEQAIDLLTVKEKLDDKNQLDQAGGIDYVTELVELTPAPENSATYAQIVQQRAQQRSLIRAGGEIMHKAFETDGQDMLSLLSDSEKLIAEIAESNRSSSGPKALSPILQKTIDHMEELSRMGDGLTGVDTGFIEINARTSGLQKADLIIVAGRPSMGKTTYSMNLVENVLINTKRPCLVFSMEMPAESIVMRMISSIGRINQGHVRNGGLDQEEFDRLPAAIKKLNSLPLFIDDTAALTPQELRSRARKVYREQGDLALIMIDYLQLMQVKGKSEGRTQEISEISRSLKALAKEFNCPVIALSQLNRSLEQRPNKRPVMSDLRESGAIEQDADIIQFLYRDEVYNEDSPEKGIAEVITGKHRNGEIGTDRLAFLGRFTRFENLARPYEEQIEQ